MLTRQGFINIYKILVAIKNENIGNLKFRYNIIKNIQILQQEVDTINEISKPFDEEKNCLIIELGKKDENTGKTFIDKNDVDIFNKRLEDIIQKYKDVIDMLDEFIDIPKFISIPINECPEINNYMLESLMNVGIIL